MLISIQRTTDSNAVAVVEKVKALLQSTTFPARWELHYSNDTTEPIKASVNATYHELFVTALVVALIVLLFLGKLNTALSVILAIPIALSASPVLYKIAGFSLNQVSLLALITAIGIVVDDSIVVSENVERYLAMGFTLKESVLRGASEVFSAVVAATLSLLSVLLPVSFIGGFIGALHSAVLPGHGRGGCLLAPGGRALPDRSPGVHPRIEAPLVGRLHAKLAPPPRVHPLGLEGVAKGAGDRRRGPRGNPDPRFHAQAPLSCHPRGLSDRARIGLLLRPHCLVSSPVLDDPSARDDRKGPGVGSRPLRQVARRGPARWTLGSDRLCPAS